MDTNGDGIGDTPFHEVMGQIEAILLNPGASHADLTRAKELAEAVNLSD